MLLRWREPIYHWLSVQNVSPLLEHPLDLIEFVKEHGRLVSEIRLNGVFSVVTLCPANLTTGKVVPDGVSNILQVRS